MAGQRGSTFPTPVFDAELRLRLQQRNPGLEVQWADRARWFLVMPDQLNLGLGPWRGAEPGKCGIILLESGEWLSRRPYHRQRLAWILLSQRMFALEAADAGFVVRVLRGDEPLVDLLRSGADSVRLEGMEPAEREVRAELSPLIKAQRLTWTAHDGFISTPVDLEHARTAEGWRMDRFYQRLRQRTGILMERGKPFGGKYSFDAENRKRWDGTPRAPDVLSFPGSLLREEVTTEIESRFTDHPGSLDVSVIPATQAEIGRFLRWAMQSCLPYFGPFEDAMSRRSKGVFHTRLSPLINLHRLLPRTVVESAVELDIPIASKEGFVRQILGWREFVFQVHRATDGFRMGVTDDEAPLEVPGDAGFERWSGRPWKTKGKPPAGVDGGARPNSLRALTPLPPAWWGRRSGLACLDHVVEDVWLEGWSHHITRLMVLSNIATLAGIEPRQLCDWFWIAYIDAWDWVVEPNVLGMSTYGFTGMTTKPYVSGSAYLEKMGDSCGTCRFEPGKNCPIGPSYWDFLSRNAGNLSDNPRMKLPLASARNRSPEQRSRDHDGFVALHELLIKGEAGRVSATAGGKSRSRRIPS